MLYLIIRLHSTNLEYDLSTMTQSIGAFFSQKRLFSHAINMLFKDIETKLIFFFFFLFLCFSIIVFVY